MANLDTAAIQDIGSNATPDFAGAQARGLTLADLYDQNQLNKIHVKEATDAQSDMTYAKQILAGKDLSKLEDQNAAVAEITKRNPQLGMQLMKGFSSQRQDAAKENLDQLDLYKAKNDVIGGQLYSLKEKHDAILQANPKATPQQIHDAMQQDVIGMVTQLSQATTPNGQPLLNNQDRQLLMKGLGNGYDPQFINTMVQRSQQARQAIQDQLKQRDADRKDKHEEAYERNALSVQAGRAERSANAAEGLLDDVDAKEMAEQYLAGDKSVMTGLGRGAQGAKNIIKVRRAIREAAEKAGLNGADIAAKLAEYQGYVAEQRTLGTSTANVQQASSEAGKMIQNAREASAKVPRAKWLPWSQLSQMTDKQLNDPDLVSLKGATTEVINTWARAINPKGVATVEDKKHGYELLNAAQDQEAYTAQLDQFEKAIKASLEAPPEVKEYLHNLFVGKKADKTPPPAAAPGATPSPPVASPTAAAGGTTVLKFDAKGNPIS